MLICGVFQGEKALLVESDDDGLFNIDFGTLDAVPSNWIQLLLYPNDTDRFQENLFMAVDIKGCGDQYCKTMFDELQTVPEGTSLSKTRAMRGGVDVSVEDSSGNSEDISTSSFASIDESTTVVTLQVSSVNNADLTGIAINAMLISLFFCHSTLWKAFLEPIHIAFFYVIIFQNFPNCAITHSWVRTPGLLRGNPTRFLL